MQKSEDKAAKSNRCFIGGLTQSLDRRSIHSYLRQFGELRFLNLTFNPRTDQISGYGFVEFRDFESASKAISKPEHIIKGVKIKIDRMMSYDESKKQKFEKQRKKLFLGKLPQTTTRSDIELYFSLYGEIEEIFLNHIYIEGRKVFRGFEFLVMKTTEDTE